MRSGSPHGSVHIYFSPLYAGHQANLFSLVPDSCPFSNSVSPLPTAAALLEMTGAAQTVVGLRDGEGPEEGVVCSANGEPL